MSAMSVSFSEVQNLARKLRDTREDIVSLAKHQASCMEVTIRMSFSKFYTSMRFHAVIASITLVSDV